MEKQKMQQPDEKPGPKVRTGYLYALAAVMLLAGVYYLLTELKVFKPREKTIQSLASAYQLYTANERKRTVGLFFGDPDSEGFKTAKAEIYETEQLVNQVKQALMLLMEGPKEQGFINLLPEGAFLREAYLDPNSILYIDLTPEITVNSKGGTTAEYAALYSILNTVFFNFPWVKGIRVLVNGEEKQSINGHISIEGILSPDTDFSGIKL